MAIRDRIGADRHAVADRFVDRAGRHVVRVEVAVVRIHAAATATTPPASRARAEPRPRRSGRRLHAPTSGLITLPPCTSWSYWRMTHSLLATLSEPRICCSSLRPGWSSGLSPADCVDAPLPGGSLIDGFADRPADDRRAGSPSPDRPLLAVVLQHQSAGCGRTVPMTVASTPSDSHSA